MNECLSSKSDNCSLICNKNRKVIITFYFISVTCFVLMFLVEMYMLTFGKITNKKMSTTSYDEANICVKTNIRF